jgi:hypothetical protein
LIVLKVEIIIYFKHRQFADGTLVGSTLTTVMETLLFFISSLDSSFAAVALLSDNFIVCV